MNTEDTKKLFIFEPYGWDYCGGAIGVIAHHFIGAVDAILEADKKRAKQKNIDYEYDECDCRRYKRDYFQRTRRAFSDDSWDQWLLTHTMTVVDIGPDRVLFDNWNNA